MLEVIFAGIFKKAVAEPGKFFMLKAVLSQSADPLSDSHTVFCTI